MDSARVVDIHKAGGIVVRDRRLLVTRSRGKKLFINPGGKVHAGETLKQALARELMEELCIAVAEVDLQEFGTFYALAAEQEDRWLRMDVFMVLRWEGEPEASSEVEELKWLTSELEPGVHAGSIFEHEVMPRLKAANLID